MEEFNLLEFLSDSQIRELYDSIIDSTDINYNVLDSIHPRDLQIILDDYADELEIEDNR